MKSQSSQPQLTLTRHRDDLRIPDPSVPQFIEFHFNFQFVRFSQLNNLFKFQMGKSSGHRRGRSQPGSSDSVQDAVKRKKDKAANKHRNNPSKQPSPGDVRDGQPHVHAAPKSGVSHSVLTDKEQPHDLPGGQSFAPGTEFAPPAPTNVPPGENPLTSRDNDGKEGDEQHDSALQEPLAMGENTRIMLDDDDTLMEDLVQGSRSGMPSTTLPRKRHAHFNTREPKRRRIESEPFDNVVRDIPIERLAEMASLDPSFFEDIEDQRLRFDVKLRVLKFNRNQEDLLAQIKQKSAPTSLPRDTNTISQRPPALRHRRTIDRSRDANTNRMDVDQPTNSNPRQQQLQPNGEVTLQMLFDKLNENQTFTSQKIDNLQQHTDKEIHNISARIDVLEEKQKGQDDGLYNNPFFFSPGVLRRHNPT